MARKKSVRRRRSGGGLRGGFVNTALIQQAATAAAAGVGVELVVNRLPIPQLQTGNGRILGKVLVSAVGSMIVGKFVGPKFGAAVALGGMVSAANDLIAMWARPGVQGLGAYRPLDVIEYRGLGCSPSYGELAGLGCAPTEDVDGFNLMPAAYESGGDF